MEIELAAIGWFWLLAFIPFVDYNPGKGFLPEDESSMDIFHGPPLPPKDKWYGKSYLDEAGIGLVALAIILFSKPWK